jgi:hypothetical protein
MTPIDQTTPIITTTKEIKTTLNDLKNKNNKIEVTIRASKTNKPNSDFTLNIVTDLMKGRPENLKFEKWLSYDMAKS